MNDNTYGWLAFVMGTVFVIMMLIHCISIYNLELLHHQGASTDGRPRISIKQGRETGKAELI